jgi:hypothetical protein
VDPDVSDETTATFVILRHSASFNIKVSFDNIWILKLCRLVSGSRRFGRNNCYVPHTHNKVSFDNKMVRDRQGHILAQDRQCAFSVTLKSVRVTTVAVEN